MTTWVRNAVLVAAMFAASGLALALKPTIRVADSGPRFSLESAVPRELGEWQEARFGAAQIVDPQQKAMIDKIYNQTLSRTYVDAKGYAVMLSIAYGSDQSDTLQLHKPEVCYPAQGFQVESRSGGLLQLPDRAIAVTRLSTSLGPRKEPVTYWTTVGGQVVTGGVAKKLVEMQFGLTGRIPDGMLVRISSIDSNPERAFGAHARFAEAMIGAVPLESRARLAGSQQSP